MARKLITILGITGTQGGSVANRFLARPDWRVRGLTRNPASAKAQALTSRGVEMVKGDHDDMDSLKAAFQGTHAIFAVTDGAANFSRVSTDEAMQEKARAAGRTIGQYAGDLEAAQGITIAKAAADPNVLATLERFVFSTLPPMTEISGGKLPRSYEFDSKAAAERYMREELPELRARLSTVTMGVFQETWRDIPAFRPHKLADGTFEYVRLDVPWVHEAIPEVVASRDTGIFVEALVLDHPAGTDVLGATKIITKPDYVALWARTLGVQAKVRDVPEEEYIKYIPEGFEGPLLDDLMFFAEYGYTGGNPRVKTPAELGIKTGSLEEFFRGEDWSAVLSGEI